MTPILKLYNKYFELLRTEILNNKPEKVKLLLKEEEFNDLNDKEKVILLLKEDTEGYNLLTLALFRSPDTLSVLLNSKAFSSLSDSQCFEILNRCGSANNAELLSLAVTKTPKEIHLLLDSRLVQKLSTENLFKLLTKNENGEIPLNLSIKISPDNMKTFLDSIALERLDSGHLLKLLLGNEDIDSPLILAMKLSLNHMRIFLDSKAIERLDSEKAFEYLHTIIDDTESVNVVWNTLLRFDIEYLSTLLNSKIFNKLSSEQSGRILSTVYENNHEEILLNYLLKFRDFSYMEAFLNSTAFSKLGITEVKEQFEVHDIDNKAILDIATSRKPEFLKLLLDCDNCLKTLPDEEKIDVLTSRSLGVDLSPLAMIVESQNIGYIEELFNSNAISSMDEPHINTLNSFIKDNALGGIAMNTIRHNPEKLIAFITSKTFQKIDQEQQVNLIGEDLLNKVNSCFLVEEQHYNMTCVGEAIQEIDY